MLTLVLFISSGLIHHHLIKRINYIFGSTSCIATHVLSITGMTSCQFMEFLPLFQNFSPSVVDDLFSYFKEKRIGAVSCTFPKFNIFDLSHLPGNC